MKTVSELGRDHDLCTFSTGIADGELTAGQGKLNEFGYFAIPCPECAGRMSAKLQDHSRQAVAIIESLFARHH